MATIRRRNLRTGKVERNDELPPLTLKDIGLGFYDVGRFVWRYVGRPLWAVTKFSLQMLAGFAIVSWLFDLGDDC